MLSARAQTFGGRAFSRQEVALVQEIVETCGGVSFTELAHTVCELLEWKRPNGKLMESQKAPVKAGKRWEVEVLYVVKASDQPRPRVMRRLPARGRRSVDRRGCAGRAIEFRKQSHSGCRPRCDGGKAAR